MAEQLTAEVGAEESAGSAVSPGADRSAETPQYLTREEFEDRFNAGLNGVATYLQGVVNKAFDGNKSHFDRAVHQISSKLGVSQERANAILDEMAANQGISAEQIEAVNAKIAAKTQAEQDAEERAALKAELEARDKAERERAEAAAKQTQGDAVDPAGQAVMNALWTAMTEDLVEFATSQDVGEKVVQGILTKLSAGMKVPASANLVAEVKKIKAQARTAIQGAADAALREKEASRAEVDTSVSNGGTGTAYDNYIKALREGKPLPSPAEIDRITAGRFA